MKRPLGVGTGLHETASLPACPFCGKDTILVKRNERLRIRCLACGAQTDDKLMWGSRAPERRPAKPAPASAPRAASAAPSKAPRPVGVRRIKLVPRP